jgi:hypothetical protein
VCDVVRVCRFCNECLAAYVTLTVSEGRIGDLRCAASNCAVPLDVATSLLLLGADSAGKLLRFSAVAQVRARAREEKARARVLV